MDALKVGGAEFPLHSRLTVLEHAAAVAPLAPPRLRSNVLWGALIIGAHAAAGAVLFLLGGEPAGCRRETAEIYPLTQPASRRATAAIDVCMAARPAK